MFKTIATLFMIVTLTAINALAQAEQIFVVNIPFEFVASKKALPAGTYTIKRLSSDSENTLVIRSQDGRVIDTISTNSSLTNKVIEKGRLVFYRMGDRHFLAEIQAPGDTKIRAVNQTDNLSNLQKKTSIVLTAPAK
ncbi:MAG: hypothetical protein JNN15_04635 [Blastocatellia bacterium]|nr:hypothetical protein [Blastocatellia bacterium]